MKNRQRKRIIITALILMICVGCSKSKSINVAEIIGTDKMQIERYRAAFVIDEKNIESVATYASYIFVADVLQYDKTEYLGDDEDSPVTYYKARVKYNIKGKLRDDVDIVIKKAGGLRKDTDTFLICEGDLLPEPGQTYLFAAVMFEDDLYCPMPNMVVQIDKTDDLSKTEAVQRYVSACNNPNPDVPDGKENKSKYDAEGK